MCSVIGLHTMKILMSKFNSFDESTTSNVKALLSNPNFGASSFFQDSMKENTQKKQNSENLRAMLILYFHLSISR